MAHQCVQATEIALLKAEVTSVADDISEIKWLVRVCIGATCTLFTKI